MAFVTLTLYITDNSHVGTDTLRAEHLIVQGLLQSSCLKRERLTASLQTPGLFPLVLKQKPKLKPRKSPRKEQDIEHLSSMFKALGSNSGPGGINKTTATKPTRVS